MEDLIAAVIGIVLMLAFAGGLAWLIGSPPLLIIIGGVLLMAVFDVVRTLRELDFGETPPATHTIEAEATDGSL